MKVVLEVDDEDLESALRLARFAQPMFARSGGKVGWGWSLTADNGKTYFVRELKAGLSVRPTPSAV